MNDERLAEIEAQAEAATPGECRFVAYYKPTSSPNPTRGEVQIKDDGGWQCIAVMRADDAALYLAARTAVPELVAEVRRLRAEVRGLAVFCKACSAAPGESCACPGRGV